jgi:hypothetical protein
MWTLILIAMHVNNSANQPGRVELEFKDRISCELALSSMKFELKFNNYKVEGKCIQK